MEHQNIITDWRGRERNRKSRSTSYLYMVCIDLLTVLKVYVCMARLFIDHEMRRSPSWISQIQLVPLHEAISCFFPCWCLSRFFKEHRVEVEVRGEALFGIHPVSLALQAHKRTLHRLYVKQNTEFGGEGRGVIEQADKLGIPVQWVTKQALNQLSGSRPNQGVCMDVSKLHIPTASSHIW